jgi:hypothetical protein
MSIEKRYQIEIGHDPADKTWHAKIFSIKDLKAAGLKHTSLRLLLAAITKKLREKRKKERRFPLPSEEPKIIRPPMPRVIITDGG